jgi:hypothetical protein
VSHATSPTPDRALSTEVKGLTDIMDKPNLVGLSYALRHPETWPKDFIWDYKSCDACAVGLARRLWATRFSSFPLRGRNLEEIQNARETFVAREMAMSHREAKRIFFHLHSDVRKVKDGWFRSKTIMDFSGVTADDVADEIDEYLKAAA